MLSLWIGQASEFVDLCGVHKLVSGISAEAEVLVALREHQCTLLGPQMSAASREHIYDDRTWICIVW